MLRYYGRVHVNWVRGLHAKVRTMVVLCGPLYKFHKMYGKSHRHVRLAIAYSRGKASSPRTLQTDGHDLAHGQLLTIN